MDAFQSPQDEGYSEDPLTIQPSEIGRRSIIEQELMSLLPTMTLDERTRLALKIINDLPTTTVAEIVNSLRPRLYLDFFDRLPPEVCLRILSFLDPNSLICTARASQSWMSLALDRKLWEHLYYMEGWHTIPEELKSFEAELANQESPRSLERSRSDHDVGPVHKRRATPTALMGSPRGNEDIEMPDAKVSQPSLFGAQSSLFGSPSVASSRNSVLGPSKILTSEPESQYPLRKPNEKEVPTSKPMKFDLNNTQTIPNGTADLSSLTSLVVRDRRSGRKYLNWQYLYTQRRRLEANWDEAKYINFQIPHPDFMHQVHKECIYTIQHQGRYLVSGSRDKSLRIWDLETRRLVREPLLGHKGSVLCLQFDATPSEDLIVSGSSDSSIILWKFSTGEKIQTLNNAHHESVLNVRFDSRILVTCSKDKSIKIFNRRIMKPGDVGYPMKAHIGGVASVPTILNNYGFNPSPLSELPMIKPYSLIGCLDGHGAAVNAIQIHGDEIVSASGDRNIKHWDWPMQSCTRTFIGHQKGIACVQYDGRRIVSGSSDNEVKVFDARTGLEVASLRSHTSLVRTVQAGFGDLPYSAEQDAEDARNVDDSYFRAVDSGSVPRVMQMSRGRERNAGSSKPEHIMAYGAKLPPGGGGGPYGRIVSGSYDETVIIWRRDKEGAWRVNHRLRQEDAASAAERNAPLNVPPPPEDEAVRASAQSHRFSIGVIDDAIGNGILALEQALIIYPWIIDMPHLGNAINSVANNVVRQRMRQAVRNRQAHNLSQRSMTVQALQGHLGLQTTSTSNSSSTDIPSASPSTPASTPSAQTGTSSTAAQAGSFTWPHPGASNQAQTPSHAQSQSSSQSQSHAQTMPAPSLLSYAPSAAGVPPRAPPFTAPTNGASMARVFKLQFDARRIICCSQTPVIVGWDFANGDERIIEASKFFAPIQ